MKNKNNVGFIAALIMVPVVVALMGPLFRHQEEPVHKTRTVPVSNDVSPTIEESAPVVEPEIQAPESEPEPELEEVEYFYADRSRSPITCKESSLDSCGANLQRCSDGFSYYCVQNLKAEYRMELPKLDQQ